MSAQQTGKLAKGVTFTDCPFAISLASELAKGPVNVSGPIMTNGIRIVDAGAEEQRAPANAGPVDAMMEADEDFARKLQAKMAVQAQAGAGRCGTGEDMGLGD